MSEQTKELIKFYDFNEIYLDISKRSLKVYAFGKQQAKSLTIPVYNKPIENMNNQELFTYLTDLFFSTGDIVFQGNNIDTGNKRKITLENVNGKIIHIIKNNNVELTEKFYKKCDISRFKGFTDKVDNFLIKENINIEMIPSAYSSVNEYSISSNNNCNLLFHLNNSDTDISILNYIISKFAKNNDYTIERVDALDTENGNILKIVSNGQSLIIKGDLIYYLDSNSLDILEEEGFIRQLKMEDFIYE